MSSSYALAPESQLDEVIYGNVETGNVSQKLWGLDQMGQLEPSPRTREVLYKALEDREALVRARAARVFGLWGKEEGVDRIVPMLRAGREFERASAGQALRMVGGPVATKALKGWTFYLTRDEVRAQRQKAQQLRELVEGQWQVAETPTEVQTLAREHLQIMERLAVAAEYHPDIMEDYHAAHRWWEEIRRAKGWDKDQYHFLIVVPTLNRPELLRRLFDSLLDELEAFGYGGTREGVWRKVHVLVLDDSDDPQKANANRVVVEQIQQRGLRVDYWSERRQKDFLVQLNTRDPSIPLERFMKKSQEALEHPDEPVFAAKGYAGARNMSRLAAAVALGELPEQSLVLFLDDDVKMGKLLDQGFTRTEEHFGNYFAMADEVFAANPGLLVGGGGYTMDADTSSTSAVHGLTGIYTLLSTMSTVAPHTSYRQEVLGFFRPSKGSEVATVEDVLGKFLDFTHDFVGGKFANVVATYNPNPKLMREGALIPSPEPSTALGGANILMRPEILHVSLPYVDVPRGEDYFFLKMFELFHPQAVGIVEELSVIHERSPQERMSFFEEMQKDYFFSLFANYLFGESGAPFQFPPRRDLAKDKDLLRLVAQKHSAFGEVALTKEWGWIRKNFVANWKGNFEPIRVLGERLERFLDPSKPEYWWNHSKSMQESVNTLRELLVSVKKLGGASELEIEQAHAQAAADAFMEQMNNFVATIEASPAWEQMMLEIKNGTITERRLGASSNNLDIQRMIERALTTAL